MLVSQTPHSAVSIASPSAQESTDPMPVRTSLEWRGPRAEQSRRLRICHVLESAIQGWKPPRAQPPPPNTACAATSGRLPAMAALFRLQSQDDQTPRLPQSSSAQLLFTKPRQNPASRIVAHPEIPSLSPDAGDPIAPTSSKCCPSCPEKTPSFATTPRWTDPFRST